MKYFPDEEDEVRGMRDYRRARDSYDFSLETRHVALFMVVFLIMAVLVFSVGYMVGRSSAFKEVEIAATTPPEAEPMEEEAIIETEEPEVTFYETLTEEGEIQTEIIGPETPPITPVEEGQPEEVATTEEPPKHLYFIQVFSTKDKEKAEGLVKALKADGYDAYTRESDAGYVRVRIKWFDTKEEAEKAKEELLSIKGYKDFFINSEPEIRIGIP
jgi:hypothetical protein